MDETCTIRILVARMRFIIPVLVCALTAGCGESSERKAQKTAQALKERATDVRSEKPSAHFYLSKDDLREFQPGGSKREILESLRWRGNFYMATEHDGKAIYVISYNVFAGGPKNDEGEIIDALFVDDTFAKVVQATYTPKHDDFETFEFQGATLKRPKGSELGDARWLWERLEADSIDLTELEKEVLGRPVPPSHVDPGLAAIWKVVGHEIPKASAQDYRRNALLRDQFNAALLDLGMTEAEVEEVFKAKPLEEGAAASGTYKIYGSDEMFKIDAPDYTLHYSNVLVWFRSGGLRWIYCFPPTPEHRLMLSAQFDDLRPPSRK